MGGFFLWESQMIKRLFLALAVTVGLLSPAYSAGLYPLSRYQQFDANGKLMVGAKLYLFNGGTSTPRIGYKDSSLTAPHPSPIVADAAGRLPLIYLADGFYRQRLTTATGVQVFDDDGLPVLSTTAGGSGTSVDPDSVYKTGDVKVRYDDQPLAGYVRMNGRTIGSPSSGATERANADTQPLYEFLWPRSNTVVAGGKGASAAADFAANKAMTLPDGAGRNIAGMDDMGAGARGVLTATSCVNASVLGGLCGIQASTIAQLQLPSFILTSGTGTGSVTATGTTGIESQNHTHAVVGTTGIESQDHTHGYVAPNGALTAYTGGAGIAAVPGTGAAQTGGVSQQHNHSVNLVSGGVTAQHTHNVAVTGTATVSGVSIHSGGGNVPFATLAPTILFTIYIRL